MTMLLRVNSGLLKMRRKMRGEEVLDEHLFYGRVFEIGVDGVAAEVGEGGEALDEGAVGFVLGFNDGHCALGHLRDAQGEFADGAVPFFDDRFAELEEGVQDVDELLRVGDVGVVRDAAVLDEDGAGGGLEEDVGARVAEGELLFHFDAEVVFGVLGLPPGAGKIEGVEQGGVGAEGMFAGAGERVFGDKEPVELAGAFFGGLRRLRGCCLRCRSLSGRSGRGFCSRP